MFDILNAPKPLNYFIQSDGDWLKYYNNQGFVWTSHASDRLTFVGQAGVHMIVAALAHIQPDRAIQIREAAIDE